MPVRNPLEVAASLKRRDGFIPAKSHLLWLRHVLDAEHATRGLQRAVISYDALVEDWRQVVTTVTPQLRLSWPRRSGVVEFEIDQYLSTTFKHHTVTPEHLVKAELVDWLRESYAALIQLAGRPDHMATIARLDGIRASFDKASAAFGVALAMNEMEVAKRNVDVQLLTGELGALRATATEREREQRDTVAAMSSELGALNNAVKESEARLAEQDKKLFELANELAASRQKAEAHAHERDQLVAALQEEKAVTARANEQVAALNREADSLRATATEREREQRGTVAAMSSELGALNNAVKESEARLAEQDKKLSELANELAASRQNTEARAHERDRLFAALESEKAATAQIADRLASARAGLRGRDDDIRKLSQRP